MRIQAGSRSAPAGTPPSKHFSCLISVHCLPSAWGSQSSATLSAIFFLGAAAAVEAALKFDPSVLRVTLLPFVGALAFEATRNEIEAEPPRPSRRRRPLWLVGGAIIAFAIPALLGDPTPARSGVAIGLGAGALATAFAAARAMRKADGLEITSWAGGLGGGRASFRLSRAAGVSRHF